MFIEILHRESGITASAFSHRDSGHERIHAIMRRKSNGMAEIRHMVALLNEAAHLILDYPAFEAICADSLLPAWTSDRLTGKRELHNRRRGWLRLFRHFAPLHGIEKEISIRAEKRNASFKARSGARSVVSN